MQNKVKVEVDTLANALYIRLSDAEVSHTLELSLDVYADIDQAGNVVGFEVLRASSIESYELPTELPVSAEDAGAFFFKRAAPKAA